MKRAFTCITVIAVLLAFLSTTGCKTQEQGADSSAEASAESTSESGSASSETDTGNQNLSSSEGSSMTTSGQTASNTDSESNTVSNTDNNANESAASDGSISGEGYSPSGDSFYDKSRLYVTWVNVWDGSSESWWSDYAKTTSVQGIRALINGEYTTINNMNSTHRTAIASDAFHAGIDTLAMDLTNGYSGWKLSSRHYQQLCYENGKKFTVAVHPTDAGNLEAICQYVWQTYAALGEVNYSSAYLYKDGKPLLVLYCTPAEFASSTAATTEYANKFTFVWASGENSKVNKWGWQIVPQDGPMASSDSMYVTPSIAWNSPSMHGLAWRSSLAMLDFCFLAAGESQPKFTIVGSIDDIFERNGWMIEDTSNAISNNTAATTTSGLGLQMKDIYGNISNDTYYNRVASWINGTASSFVPGGILNDGAYTITGISSGLAFGVTRPSAGDCNDIQAPFYSNCYLTKAMETYYWFYHLGNNEYRIIKLTSGLSLEASGSTLIQDWTGTDDSQRWIINDLGSGAYQIVNKATGQLLTDAGSGGAITLGNAGGNTGWQIAAVAGRTMN